jgi:anti-sigma regulatory factor (Ser/Thr protein kinase)
MSSPVAPSTLDPHEQRKPSYGDGIGLPSLDHLSSADLVVWRATGPLSPVMPTETERRFKFRGMPQAVGAARRVLRAWEGHFEPDLFYDLSLCVSELVTNRIRQAESAGGDELELVVRRSEALVRAEVREPRPDGVLSQPLVEPLSDLGMFIVDRVADRWGVDRSEGTVVWCEIDLASDGRSRNAPPLGTTLSSLPF